MDSRIEELYRIHEKSEGYKQQITRLNIEMRKEDKTIESILSGKFKVRGIHSEVEEYSLEDNIVSLRPVYPDCGIDNLILSFSEFAEQVEFITE